MRTIILRVVILFGFLSAIGAENSITIERISQYPVEQIHTYNIQLDSWGSVNLAREYFQFNKTENVLISNADALKTGQTINLRILRNDVHGDEQSQTELQYQEINGAYLIQSLNAQESALSGIRRDSTAEFTRYYNDLIFYTINLDPNDLWYRDVLSGTLPTRYRFDDDRRLCEIYNAEQTLAHVTWNGEFYTIEEVPTHESPAIYTVRISEDYVPPEDMMVRVFNVFATVAGRDMFLMPFLAGYF